MDTSFSNVDEYIKGFPEEVQVILQQVRAAIRQSAPDAVESISYAMPAYKIKGVYSGAIDPLFRRN